MSLLLLFDTPPVGWGAIVNSVNMTVTDLGDGFYRVTKTGGIDNSWDSLAVSTAAKSGSIRLRIAPTAGWSKFGISTAPGTAEFSPNYSFQFAPGSGGGTYYSESPSTTVPIGGANWNTGEVFWLDYDQSTAEVKYYKGNDFATATLLRTATGVPNGPYYFDGQAYNSGGSADVLFWETAPPSLFPSLFTNSQSFHSPTVTPGVSTLTPSLVADGDTFPTPTVTRGTITLTPGLVSDGDSFHAPTVTTLTTLSPSLYTDTDSFHVPTLTRGMVTLAPSLVTDADTFFAPSVTSLKTLSPSLVTDADTFFAPTVTASYTLAPSLFANSQTFHIPTVSSSYTLLPTLLTDADTFHAPTITTSYALIVGLVNNSQSFYTPMISLGGTQTLTPSLFTNSPSFPTPQVLSTAGGGAVAKPKVSAFFFRQ